MFQISLGKSGFELNGCTAFVTGHGVIDVDEDQKPYGGVVMELSTRVYDADYCNSLLYIFFDNVPDIYSSQICADSNQIREDACFGIYLFLFFFCMCVSVFVFSFWDFFKYEKKNIFLKKKKCIFRKKFGSTKIWGWVYKKISSRKQGKKTLKCDNFSILRKNLPWENFCWNLFCSWIAPAPIALENFQTGS